MPGFKKQVVQKTREEINKELEQRVSAGNTAKDWLAEFERHVVGKSDVYTRHFWLVIAQEAAQQCGMSVVNPTEQYVLNDEQAREFEKTQMKGTTYGQYPIIDVPTPYLVKFTDPDHWKEKLKAYVRWRIKTNPQDES